VRIWRVEPPNDGEDPEETSREGWKAEVVAEFEKGGARIGMVDVCPSSTFTSKLIDSGTQRGRH
jgi:hypothetical protein